LLLEEFARRYADSFYAAHARVRIEELKKRQVAVVVPPVPPGAPPNAGPRPTFGVYLEAPKPVPGVTPLSVARERALQPKETFKECDACPEMVVIPRGTFTMGSPAAEKERESHEGPQRLVTFSRQLAVGVFAVTFDEWDACVAGGGCGHRPADQGWGRGRRPVINVSWKDANAYLLWLSRKTGKTYRLLSEAEREYVARAGTTTPFWWGSSISSSQANYDGNYTYNDGPKGERRGRTVPVDSFLPNPFGLYQVHGNVWEWTGDCWNDSHSGAATDGAALITAGCRDRVLRGGSWDKGPLRLRSACRDRGHPDVRSDYLGFRVARTLDP
jgi:formylglycine-generating enzyme required for sulfatase activity